MLEKIAAFVEGKPKPGLFTLRHLDTSCAFVCNCARRGRAGQGNAGQGRAGQGRAGQGRAEQGRAEQAGQGRAGQT